MATRAHPDYELVLISNRDEFFARKTHDTCWNQKDFILHPYDMSLNTPNFGTWLGVNRNGRLGTILNLRLENDPRVKQCSCLKSRGKIPLSYLSSRESKFKEWDTFQKFEERYPDLNKTGDFNFFYGSCIDGVYRIIDSLGHTFAVLTNDDCHSDEAYLVVSNDVFHVEQCNAEKNKEWGKIKLARQAVRELFTDCHNLDEGALLTKCFELASFCPFEIKSSHGEYHMKASDLAKETIFTPPLKVSSNDDLGTALPIGDYYGTRSQIVILVSKDRSHVTFVERILHSSDEDVEQYRPDHPRHEKRFDFDISL